MSKAMLRAVGEEALREFRLDQRNGHAVVDNIWDRKSTVEGESELSSLDTANQHIVDSDPEIGVHQWLGIRKDEALKIDPATAEVTWRYALTLDPYGVRPELPEEVRQVGREYFARAPGSEVWVHFHDLPDEVRAALLKGRNERS